MSDADVDKTIKIMDWVILFVAVLISVFIGMGLTKKYYGKHSHIYGISMITFLLGMALRNILSNKSWK